VFDDVGYVHLLTLEVDGGEEFLKELSCGADKRTALLVFVKTRRFSNEHEAGILRALAGHGPVCGLVQNAALAGSYFPVEIVQGRHVIRRSDCVR
jgi:hypothetical protein